LLRGLPASLRWLEITDYSDTARGLIKEILGFVPSTVNCLPLLQLNVNCYLGELGELVLNISEAFAALRLKGTELHVGGVTDEEDVETSSLDFFESL
jgi:hypothetical protein